MRADHRVVGETRVRYSSLAHRVQGFFRIVSSDARRSGEEPLERVANRVVRESPACKLETFAASRRYADRIALQREGNSLARGNRIDLAGEPCELGRIDRRNVTAVLAAQPFGVFEERQIRRRLELRQQRLELELAIEAIEIVRGRHRVAAALPVDRQRQVAPNQRDGAAKLRLFAVLANQILELRISSQRRIGHERVERPRCLQQSRRGLLSNARNAGKVIRRIAFEAAIVGQPLRIEAEALANRHRIVTAELADAASRRQHGRALVDDLQQIEIAGDDQRLLAALFGLSRQRGDYVVGFLSFDFDDRNTVRIENPAHQRELAAQLVGHHAALRLVFGIERHALGRHSFIECRENVRRFFVGDELVEHHRETVGGIDRHSAARVERGQREKGPVDQAVGVEQHQRHRKPRLNAPKLPTTRRSRCRRRRSREWKSYSVRWSAAWRHRRRSRFRARRSTKRLRYRLARARRPAAAASGARSPESGRDCRSNRPTDARLRSRASCSASS